MLNDCTVMGRLSADPELKTTTTGIKVCSFTVACNRDFGGKGEDRPTDWIDVVAWRQTAEFVSNYFNKGSMIIVQGSIQTRYYEDKNGNKRKAVEIVANNVYFGESKHSGGTQDVSAPSVESDIVYDTDEFEDRLPF